MKNLIAFPFTALSDRALSDEGWFVLAGDIVDALAGHDVITGFAEYGGIANSGTIKMGIGVDSIIGRGYYAGLVNAGIIDTGVGNDLIEGYLDDYGNSITNAGSIFTGAGADTLYGWASDAGTGSISNSGIINTGAGNDIIDANGITNSGTIYTGPGNDSVVGWPFEAFYGIVNSHRIAMDTGNDRITGGGRYHGIWNQSGALITTGDGDDVIEAQTEESYEDDYGAFAIKNLGLIDTGNGNDVIKARIFERYASWSIENLGSITTGGGADTIDALWGGFFGRGLTDLGSGSDTLKGFGTGVFRGGTGIDTMVFTPGRYVIRRLGGGEFLIGGQMRVSGFEAFGDGANHTNFATAVSHGSVIFS